MRNESPSNLTAKFAPSHPQRRVLALCAVIAGVACADGTPGLVYAASSITDEVVVFAASNGALVDRFAVDPRPTEVDEPHALAVDPAGAFLYVTVAHGEPTLWKFELPSHRLVGRLSLPIYGAGRIGMTSDGAHAFVADYYRDGGATPSFVAAVELHDLETIGRTAPCAGPHDAAVSPSGSLIAVACSVSDELVLLDSRTLDEHARIATDSIPGSRPLNAVWTDDDTVWVTLAGAARVKAFHTDGRPVATVPVGAGPAQLATAAGRVVTANRADGSVSIIDVDERVERVRVSLDVLHPHGIALTPDGGRIFVSYEGSTSTPGGVLALDPDGLDVVWRTDVGGPMLGVVFVPGS